MIVTTSSRTAESRKDSICSVRYIFDDDLFVVEIFETLTGVGDIPDLDQGYPDHRLEKNGEESDRNSKRLSGIDNKCGSFEIISITNIQILK